MEAVKGDNSSPQSLFCVTGGEACWAIGTGWNLKSEDLNPRAETHQLDDLEQIPFHVSVSVSSFFGNVGLTILPAPWSFVLLLVFKD